MRSSPRGGGFRFRDRLVSSAAAAAWK